jgi:hypothetical protein
MKCYFNCRLTRVLNDFGEGDWQLATLICQALWNYCIESTNLHEALGIDETNHLLGILVDLLGKVIVQDFFRTTMMMMTTTSSFSFPSLPWTSNISSSTGYIIGKLVTLISSVHFKCSNF